MVSGPQELSVESKDENKTTRMVTGPLHAIFFSCWITQTQVKTQKNHAPS